MEGYYMASQVKTAQVKYAQARILAADYQDIAVFEPSTGDIFRFDGMWSNMGSDGFTRQELEPRLGILGMDNYVYIWIYYI
jgi:hypothetical protein